MNSCDTIDVANGSLSTSTPLQSKMTIASPETLRPDDAADATNCVDESTQTRIGAARRDAKTGPGTNYFRVSNSGENQQARAP